jgi:hypothetical protein
MTMALIKGSELLAVVMGDDDSECLMQLREYLENMYFG